MNEQTCPWAIKDADGKTIGIGIPVINKALYFEDVPKNDKPMNWHDAMKHAKLLGRALPTQKELYISHTSRTRSTSSPPRLATRTSSMDGPGAAPSTTRTTRGTSASGLAT